MGRAIAFRASRSLRSTSNAFSASKSVSPWRCRRCYSIQSQEEQLKKLPDINPEVLSISKTTAPKPILPPEQLVFGRTFTGKSRSIRHASSAYTVAFTDHMLAIEWTALDGWQSPRIMPYQNLSLDPATCVFHYAFECFEGMKAYKNAQGQVRLFRPDQNMARLNRSSARIALPKFSPAAMIALISKFCLMEERFIPAAKGYSLYLRPTMIGTQRTIGIGPPGSALLFMIASPVGPYYPTGFKAVSLEATDYAVRAWPGGVGNMKLGANYAPCVVPQLEAAKRGFQQNLWLFGEEEYVTEVGTMNFFVAMKDQETGKKTLITAPLDGTILEGVIRDSVLDLARERLVPEGWDVKEQKFTMGDLASAADEGRLMEAFGTGTAAVVSPVRNVSWKGRMVECGLVEGEEAGDIAKRMKAWIEGIQYGDEDHPWSLKI